MFLILQASQFIGTFVYGDNPEHIFAAPKLNFWKYLQSENSFALLVFPQPNMTISIEQQLMKFFAQYEKEHKVSFYMIEGMSNSYF